MYKSFNTMGKGPLTGGFEKHLQTSETLQRVFNIITLVSAVVISLLILSNRYVLALIPFTFLVASAVFSYFNHLGVINAKMNRESEQYRIFTGCEKVVNGKSKMAVIEVSEKTDNGVLGTEIYLCDSAEEALAKLATLCFMVDWYGYISQLYQPESVKDKITMEDLNDLCRVCEPFI